MIHSKMIWALSLVSGLALSPVLSQAMSMPSLATKPAVSLSLSPVVSFESYPTTSPEKKKLCTIVHLRLPFEAIQQQTLSDSLAEKEGYRRFFEKQDIEKQETKKAAGKTGETI